MLQGVVNLPDELKTLNQWAIAAADDKGGFKAPHALDPDHKLIRVSVHDAVLSFSTACEANAYYDAHGIGFILKESDPYTCIDLDYKEGTTTVEQLQRFNKIIETFASYSEISVSGKGVHIWVKGNIGQGCRRDGIEVYSQERFIVCTGNVLHDLPIMERQELLDILVTEIRNGGNAKAQFELEEVESDYEDHEILSMATSASNSDKFNKLCEGDWESLHYPSQSEADLSLLSMLCFYSKSNEQVRRLFRMSKLGKREKAMKNDRHLDYCLKIIRSRQALEMELEKKAENISRDIYRQVAEEAKSVFIEPTLATAIRPEQKHAMGAEPPVAFDADVESNLEWPPGLTGEIAQFIYHSAQRPIKEVAIVSALGFLAGICGKAFSIPQSGLNMYLVLIGRSGTGKEAMHGGISDILKRVRESVPGVQKFITFNRFASGPALTKHCVHQSSFCSVAGEVGRSMLLRMAREDRTDGPMSQLRTVMTDLYQKSGPNSVVGGIAYSNKEDNIASVSGVAYSLIGETTPKVFYESLTESMLEDGFLSRWTIVEYNSERPGRNLNPISTPSNELTEKLCSLVVYAETLLARYNSVQVQYSFDAGVLMDAFDKECDDEINSTGEESWRQMWNRGHLKVLRLAALLAVADNHLNPVVSIEHAKWALNLVRNDIRTMSNRIESGDVGTADSTRERKILSVLRNYLENSIPESYNIPDEMRKEGVVPRRYIQLRVSRLSPFANHKSGAIVAMDQALRSLADSGYIAEIDKKQSDSTWGFMGKCYRILTVPPSIK